MKKSEPPHPTRHTAQPAGIKLTPEVNRFIHRMGDYFAANGVPRIGGLILGLLMMAQVPLSAEQIASVLKISRASVSTNFRLLAAAGLAERFTSHADRITYYEFPPDGWEQILRISEVQTKALKDIVADALGSIPSRDPVHHRLELGYALTDLLLKVFRQATDDWRAEHAAGSSVPAR